MVVRREKKRRRGERTYHGSHKKWRGKGSRGGRGKGGMMGPKWTYTVKYEPEHFGKHGFKKPKKNIKIINLDKLSKMIKEGKLNSKEIIDLTKFGYDKLLGRGKLEFPVNIKVESFSEVAKKKVEEVGGKIVE